MSVGSRAAEAAKPAIRGLFAKSQAGRYGLTEAAFLEVLEQVAEKYIPGAILDEKLDFWQNLHLEELALTRGCVAGHELAWQEFLTRYREKLYDMARGITKEDSSGRELADSLYADLYGLSEREGRRVSRLSFYMGRGSLQGWLRTVVAQEFVNRYRKQKRLVSLEEETEEGVQFASNESFSGELVDNRLAQATDAALNQLPADDRLILAGYYLDNRTLTEIGRMLGVHESTVSRRLEKLLKMLRKCVVAGLQAQGMNRDQAEEALEVDVRFVAVDVRTRLQETRARAFQEDKASD